MNELTKQDLSNINGGEVTLKSLGYNMLKGAVAGGIAGGLPGAAMGLGLGGIYHVVEDVILS